MGEHFELAATSGPSSVAQGIGGIVEPAGAESASCSHRRATSAALHRRRKASNLISRPCGEQMWPARLRSHGKRVIDCMCKSRTAAALRRRRRTARPARMATSPDSRPEGPLVQEPAHGLALRGALPGPHRRSPRWRCWSPRRRPRRPLRLQADHRQRLRHRRRHHARHRPLVQISAAAGRRAGARHRVPLLFRLLARRARGRRHPPRGARQPAAPRRPASSRKTARRRSPRG